MTKKYNSPMLQIVSIKRNDIITGSQDAPLSSGSQNNDLGLAPDRFRDDWDAGY